MKRKVILLFTALSLSNCNFVFANTDTSYNDSSFQENVFDYTDSQKKLDSKEAEGNSEDIKDYEGVNSTELPIKNTENKNIEDSNDLLKQMSTGKKYIINISSDSDDIKKDSLLIEKTEKSTYLLTMIANKTIGDKTISKLIFNNSELTLNYSNYDIISANVEIEDLSKEQSLTIKYSDESDSSLTFTADLKSISEVKSKYSLENGYYSVANFAIIKQAGSELQYDKHTSGFIKKVEVATLNGKNFAVVTFDEENSVFKNFTMTMEFWYKKGEEYIPAEVTKVSEKNCNIQFKFPISSIDTLIQFKYQYSVAEMPMIKGTYERYIYVDGSSAKKIREVSSEEFDSKGDNNNSNNNGNNNSSNNNSSSGGSSGSSGTTTLDKANLPDGVYSLEVDLWKEDLNESSMGNDAIYKKAVLNVSGGKYTISISTKPMTIGIYKAVLKGLLVLGKDGKYENADIVSTGHSLGMDTNLPTAFSFELPEKGQEYTQVRILTKFYPEFPGHDDLKARLKINWATLKADSTASLTMYSASSSESKATYLEDQNTGIKITSNNSNTFENVKLNITSSEYNEEIYYNLFYEMGKYVQKFIKYDLSFTKNSEKVNPTDTFTVTMPIPQDFDITKTELYRLNDDNTLTLINFESEENKIKFKTSTLNNFILAEVESSDDLEKLEVTSYMLRSNQSTKSYENDFYNHYAKGSIEFVKEAQILVGSDEKHFYPNEEVTLAMLITAISRIEKIDHEKYSNRENTEYYEPAMNWAKEVGLILKNSQNNVNKKLSREEVVTILSNYINIKGIKLKSIYSIKFQDDNLISSWAKEAVYNLAEAGIISGRENFIFSPSDFATRAELSIMIEKMIKSYL